MYVYTGRFLSTDKFFSTGRFLSTEKGSVNSGFAQRSLFTGDPSKYNRVGQGIAA